MYFKYLTVCQLYLNKVGKKKEKKKKQNTILTLTKACKDYGDLASPSPSPSAHWLIYSGHKGLLFCLSLPGSSASVGPSA